MDHCKEHSCQNDGVCVYRRFGYECACLNGFKGTYCEIGKICTFVW